jgi:hypothetical protein
VRWRDPFSSISPIDEVAAAFSHSAREEHEKPELAGVAASFSGRVILMESQKEMPRPRISIARALLEEPEFAIEGNRKGADSTCPI